MVILITVLVVLSAVLAEFVHWRRCRRIARMEFATPRDGLAVVTVAAVARVVGIALTAPSLLLLWESSSVIRNSMGAVASEGELDRMIVIMDASKSMNLQDAGPNAKDTRASRARELIYYLVSQAQRMPRTTLMAFGDATLPVVYDSKDWDVLSNVLLRQYYTTAFKSDKTNIDHAVQESVEKARDWIPRSTIAVLLTDGESEPTRKSFDVPRSIRHFLVLGVGSKEGRPIGQGLREVSRLDEENLLRVAKLVGGKYFDATREMPPVDYVHQVLPPPPPAVPKKTRRDVPLSLFAMGVLILGLTPIALSLVERRLLHR
jgi:hypothetical protein